MKTVEYIVQGFGWGTLAVVGGYLGMMGISETRNWYIANESKKPPQTQIAPDTRVDENKTEDTPKQPPIEYFVDRDCDDFSTPGEAQEFFERADADYHKLDRDGDGYACETL